MPVTQAGAKPAPLVSGHPLLGSMHDLQTDSLGTYLRAREEYGDVVRFVAGPPGMRLEFYGILSATGARQVLARDSANFRKDNKFYVETREALGDGLLTSQDETYLRQRRLVQPLFTHRQVDKYAALMVEEIERSAGEWEGETDVLEESTRVTLRVVAQILFGADVESAIDSVRRCFPVIGSSVSKRGLEPRSLPRTWPTPANRRLASARRELLSVCDRIIEERRRAGGDALEGDDLLTLLARAGGEDGTDGLDSDEVRDQVLIFLLAGHETTATSLGFALHLLGRHPEIQAKAYAEVEQVLGDRTPTSTDLLELPYLTMVLKESMRLYPAAPSVGRRAVEETVVDGYRIPAGADVVVAPWVIHRHPDYWSEPEEFRPERFAPDGEASRTKDAWIPFGVGPRACIGQHFSMLESVLALAILLRAYEFEAVDHEVPLSQGITLRAEGPARCRIVPRRGEPPLGDAARLGQKA